jgi:ATP-dependent Clp protease protease subunit
MLSEKNDIFLRIIKNADMNFNNDFRKYAVKHRGVNGLVFDQYTSIYNGYINPTIIEERTLNVAQMDVFSRLMMDRIIFLGTPINDDVANIIQAQLLFLESSDPNKDIQIYFNSPGGSVYAGLGIYDTMQYIRSDVATICTGMAASMAAVLLCAGAHGKRSALKHSRVMIHQPMGGAEGQASDIAIQAAHMAFVKERMNRLLSQNTGQPYERIVQDTDRDNWMTPEQALEYGLIDHIYTTRKEIQ